MVKDGREINLPRKDEAFLCLVKYRAEYIQRPSHSHTNFSFCPLSDCFCAFIRFWLLIRMPMSTLVRTVKFYPSTVNSVFQWFTEEEPGASNFTS